MPLRGTQFPEGYPWLSAKNKAIAREGNRLARITVELAGRIARAGGRFTIENPASSWLWKLPSMVELRRAQVAAIVAIAMCFYGSRAWKQTSIWASDEIFLSIQSSCTGISRFHTHIVLRGRDAVLRTKG